VRRSLSGASERVVENGSPTIPRWSIGTGGGNIRRLCEVSVAIQPAGDHCVPVIGASGGARGGESGRNCRCFRKAPGSGPPNVSQTAGIASLPCGVYVEVAKRCRDMASATSDGFIREMSGPDSGCAFMHSCADRLDPARAGKYGVASIGWDAGCMRLGAADSSRGPLAFVFPFSLPV
jgi:hypothetical protein